MLWSSPQTLHSPLFCSLHSSWSCLRMNTMSMVPRLALNPHRVSGRWSSAIVGTNLFRSTRARIFPAMESSDPLFSYKVTMTALQRSLGSLPCSQQQTRSSWSLTVKCWSSIFPELWSNPADSCCFATPQLLYGFGNFFYRE